MNLFIGILIGFALAVWATTRNKKDYNSIMRELSKWDEEE